MAIIPRIMVVTSGAWRTLQTFWHASAQARFVSPAGVQIKVRYGVGWLGWDSQAQKLDGATPSQALIRMPMTPTSHVTRGIADPGGAR